MAQMFFVAGVTLMSVALALLMVAGDIGPIHFALASLHLILIAGLRSWVERKEASKQTAELGEAFTRIAQEMREGADAAKDDIVKMLERDPARGFKVRQMSNRTWELDGPGMSTPKFFASEYSARQELRERAEKKGGV